MNLTRRQALSASAAISLPFFSGAGWNSKEEKGKKFAEFTAESKKAIVRGNKWMLKALNKDGGAGTDIGTQSEAACTSVVGIAFLSQGNTPTEGTYSRQQKKIEKFLLRAANRLRDTGQLQTVRSVIEGDLGPYAPAFFTTLYLSQVMGESKHVKPTKSAVQFLANYISTGQLEDGSWGTDNAWAPLLATACGWLSLRAANFAGVKVHGSSEAAGKFLIRRMPRLGTNWGSGSWYHRLYGTASGLRVLYSLEKENEEKARTALGDIMKLVESSNKAFGGAGGEEYLTFHLMTEMLMQEGGERWQTWYETVRDKLLEVQNKDGSWTGHHCITSRTFSTACAMMTLTAPNRYLPISQV